MDLKPPYSPLGVDIDCNAVFASAGVKKREGRRGGGERFRAYFTRRYLVALNDKRRGPAVDAGVRVRGANRCPCFTVSCDDQSLRRR